MLTLPVQLGNTLIMKNISDFIQLSRLLQIL